jgi:hypothetical protein
METSVKLIALIFNNGGPLVNVIEFPRKSRKLLDKPQELRQNDSLNLLKKL